MSAPDPADDGYRDREVHDQRKIEALHCEHHRQTAPDRELALSEIDYFRHVVDDVESQRDERIDAAHGES